MPQDSFRTARIEAGIAPEALAMEKRGAELLRPSGSDFIVATAERAAPQAIQDIHLLRLSIEDQQRFADLLLSPPAPPAALERSKNAHSRLIYDR